MNFWCWVLAEIYQIVKSSADAVWLYSSIVKIHCSPQVSPRPLGRYLWPPVYIGNRLLYISFWSYFLYPIWPLIGKHPLPGQKQQSWKNLAESGNLFLVCLFLYQSLHSCAFPRVCLQATVLRRFWPQHLSNIWIWNFLSLDFQVSPSLMCQSIIPSRLSLSFLPTRLLSFPHLIYLTWTVWYQEWASSILAWWDLGQLMFPYQPVGFINLVFWPLGWCPPVLQDREFLVCICSDWSLWLPFFDSPSPCTFAHHKFYVGCTV